jgi:hypothetical protein
MKLSARILLVTLTAGSALAQIPSVVQHVQDKLNVVQQQNKAASDAALNGNATAKAPAGKPAAATAAKPAATAVTKPASVSAASKLEPKPPIKPATTASQKAPVSPVVAKPAIAKAATQPAASKPAAVNAKPVEAVSAAPAKASLAPPAKKQEVSANNAVPKANPKPAQPTAASDTEKAETKSAQAKPAEAKMAETKPGETKDDTADTTRESGFITAGNRRDPFVSPIVQHLTGTGCSTGKRCLAIDQIALRGIVKSDAGMIAVVVNSLDQAYFLRENDPVFNGYVLKISGDSVVFKETVQDKLGHLSTREVVKKITTPAV